MAPRRHSDIATEKTVLEQCRRKDFQAFSKIVEHYQSRVHGFVRRMVRDDEDALDITQEVFIRAYQGVERFDGRCSLRTWLFRIAHNLCIDRSRSATKTFGTVQIDGDADEEPLEFSDEKWNPESLALTGELIEVVESAIEGLSDKLRVVLLLHDKENMGYDEIAKAVDVPVGTVKSRLFLARSHVQKCVAGYLGEGARA